MLGGRSQKDIHPAAHTLVSGFTHSRTVVIDKPFRHRTFARGVRPQIGFTDFAIPTMPMGRHGW